MHANLSIGYGLPHDEWVGRWSQSKFCPVIRGDTPSSHAFAAAIAGGCIPVVISTGFLLTAVPPLATSMDIRAFTVVWSERVWRHRGLPGLIEHLQAMSDQEIERKLDSSASSNPSKLSSSCLGPMPRR